MQAKHKLQELEMEQSMQEQSKLVEIHVSKNEVICFNSLQGGQSVDEQTGLREYSKLLDVLSIPIIRKLFVLMTDIIKSGEPLPEDIKQVMSEPLNGDEHGLEPIESDFDPQMKQMRDTGDGDDHYLVLMPQAVVSFMDTLQGGEKRDQSLGLQEFGFFDEIIRGVATVGGAILGGPVGAGIGNMVGKGITGGKDLLQGGIKTGLMAYGASQMLGGGGGMGGMFGGGGGMGGMMGGGGMGGPVEGQNGQYSSAYVGGNQGIGPDGVQAPMPQRGMSGPGAGGGGGMGGMGGMMDNMGPLALLGGGMYLGYKGEKEKYKQAKKVYEEDKERKGRGRRALHGMMDQGLNTQIRTPEHHIPQEHKRSAYKKGGKVIGIEIKGKGTGQSDDIPRTTKENSWVWDATTVAHAGDGTTNAGQKAIKKFEDIIVSKKLPHVKEVIKESIKAKPLRNVPCALSNGERVTPPEIVAAAGDGSFDRGSAILKKMTRELRSHKASKGLDLPPAAHDLTVYYRKALGK